MWWVIPGLWFLTLLFAERFGYWRGRIEQARREIKDLDDLLAQVRAPHVPRAREAR